MKTTRNISIVPALVVLTVLVGLALAIGILSRGGQGQQRQQNTGTADNEANAALSNIELVNKAVTNMRQLTSYHMEVSGSLVMQGGSGGPMRLLADVQLPGPGNLNIWNATPIPGSIFKFSTEAFVSNGQQLPAQEVEILWASDGWWYGSSDGGKTWIKDNADRELSSLCVLPFAYLYLPYSEEYWGARETNGTPVPASSSLAFKDGNPLLEKVDGVVTRHVVADVTGVRGDGPWSNDPSQLDLWISTDLTPTIRKLEVKGYRGTPEAFNSLGAPIDVAFSPNGRNLAVAYDAMHLAYAKMGRAAPAPEYMGAVRLWDLTEPGAVSQILPANDDLPAQGGLASISFSGDGRYLAAGRAAGGYARVWDLSAQNPLATALPLTTDLGGVRTGGVGKVAMRPDGKMVAAITSEGLFVWELPVDTTKPPLSLAKEGKWGLSALAFSPDNHILAVGLPEGAICLYDLSNPDAPPRRLAQSTNPNDSQEYPKDLAFSPDGNLLAAGNEKGVRIWNLRQAEPSPLLIPGGGPWSGEIAFGPNSRLLAVGVNERMVQVWDIGEAGQSSTVPTLLLELDAQSAVAALAFSSDGKNIAAATEAGPVLMWTLEDLQTTGKSQVPPKAQVMAGSEALELVGGEPYTITWTWSRFNEDFGVVKPPPSETVNKP